MKSTIPAVKFGLRQLTFTSHRVFFEGEYLHFWQLCNRTRFIYNGKEWRKVGEKFARLTKGLKSLRKFSLSEVVRFAGVTKLSGKWVCELDQDLKCFYHFDKNAKLVKKIATELKAEIDNDTRNKLAPVIGGY